MDTAMDSREEIQSNWPVWYLPEAPLGAAVRYIASLSPRFNWVGIYLLKRKFLELGPYIGAKDAEAQSELVVLIRDRSGNILGQIDIDSHFENAFGSEEENKVRQVAKELGELWPV
jgi:putative methionine-R-sulfoxide reductase with GAF domain